MVFYNEISQLKNSLVFRKKLLKPHSFPFTCFGFSVVVGGVDVVVEDVIDEEVDEVVDSADDVVDGVEEKAEKGDSVIFTLKL